MMTAQNTPWADASLTALDLEGTGAQDRDDERILKIAVIPNAGAARLYPTHTRPWSILAGVSSSPRGYPQA